MYTACWVWFSPEERRTAESKQKKHLPFIFLSERFASCTLCGQQHSSSPVLSSNALFTVLCFTHTRAASMTSFKCRLLWTAKFVTCLSCGNPVLLQVLKLWITCELPSKDMCCAFLWAIMLSAEGFHMCSHPTQLMCKVWTTDSIRSNWKIQGFQLLHYQTMHKMLDTYIYILSLWCPTDSAFLKLISYYDTKKIEHSGHETGCAWHLTVDSAAPRLCPSNKVQTHLQTAIRTDDISILTDKPNAKGQRHKLQSHLQSLWLLIGPPLHIQEAPCGLEPSLYAFVSQTECICILVEFLGWCEEGDAAGEEPDCCTEKQDETNSESWHPSLGEDIFCFIAQASHFAYAKSSTTRTAQRVLWQAPKKSEPPKPPPRNVGLFWTQGFQMIPFQCTMRVTGSFGFVTKVISIVLYE